MTSIRLFGGLSESTEPKTVEQKTVRPDTNTPTETTYAVLDDYAMTAYRQGI